MVHEQGDIVDSIESNIEAATVQVHEGADQLSQVRSFYLFAFKDFFYRIGMNPFNSFNSV